MDEISKSLNESGQSALHTAAKDNNMEEIKRLLSLGVESVNSKDENGLTPLLAATIENKMFLNGSREESHFDVIEVLLKNGADVNARDENGNTSLHTSARRNLKTVKLLLNYGADVNSKNNYEETPLFYASYHNELEIVKLLVEHGSSAVHKRITSATPLHYACKCHSTGRLENIKFLLNIGADMEAADGFNRTPFLWLIQRLGWHGLLLDFFIKYANINIVDSLEFNALILNRHKSNQIKLLKHFAKLRELGVTLHQNIIETIFEKKRFRNYFNKCLEELKVAKSTKLDNCWVTFFNLLVDNKRKLKNYAGNYDLIESFKNSDCLEKFPIYGPEMKKNMEKGIERRRLFDESSGILGSYLPILNPTHLIVRDVLDLLTLKDFIVMVS